MIVFDLDDTLYLERQFAFSGYRHLGSLVYRTTGAAGFGDACRRVFEDGERRRVFNRACRAVGLPDTPERIALLVKAYRAHRPRISLCEDVLRYFERVPGPYGLITDGPAEMQRNKIRALGLARWIDFLRPTGDWPEGFGKPHPRAFEEMEAFSGRGSPMVYVADNPAKDFVTPKARGWTTVQVIRPGAIHDPAPPDAAHGADVTIQTFDHLIDATTAGALR